MVKSELIKAVSARTGLTQTDSEIAINAIITEMGEALFAGQKVELRGLGSFSITNKAERMGRNPKTGEDAIIAARKVVKFTCSTVLKNHLNQK